MARSSDILTIHPILVRLIKRPILHFPIFELPIWLNVAALQSTVRGPSNRFDSGIQPQVVRATKRMSPFAVSRQDAARKKYPNIDSIRHWIRTDLGWRTLLLV